MLNNNNILSKTVVLSVVLAAASCTSGLSIGVSDSDDAVVAGDYVAAAIEVHGNKALYPYQNRDSRKSGSRKNGDSDGDGVPDRLENKLGTDPNDAGSLPDMTDSYNDSFADVIENLIGSNDLRVILKKVT